MTFSSVNPIQTLPFASPCYLKKGGDHQTQFVVLGFSTGTSVSRVLRTRAFNIRRWMLNATSTRVLDNNTLNQTAATSTGSSTIEIPVTCYQLLGVPDQAEKDEIVKSVMQLKTAEAEEGYTMDAVVSRQDILMDVRDKLLFEPEFAGNVKEKIPPKASLRIPWAWLPGALCLLQEVGEEKLVLDIGRAALRHPDAKPYVHDILLSMALAECAIAKISFEKNRVSQGFEALARAQYLLRSKISLEKMPLLSQIEESLEELAPACTLELLSMPHSPENAERRRGAMAALRELLRQGLDVEASCRVQDWPCFLNQALNRLMATEIVDLLPWDDLALKRKNKKSLESQNQRVVVDFNCFYVVLLAHLAFGFSSKQIQMIDKAKVMCECLMASEGIDLKFEEAFCLFLLGQGDEGQAVEKLHQVELNSNPATRSLVSGKDIKDGSDVKLSLETWLKDFVLSTFSDTRDCSPQLINFFRGDKRTAGIKKHKAAVANPVGHRQLPDMTLKRMESVDSPCSNTSQLVGSAVKQLAPSDLRAPFISNKNGNESDDSEPSKLSRDLGVYHHKISNSWLAHWDVVRKATFVAVLGCIMFITFKLYYVSASKRTALRFGPTKPGVSTSSVAWKETSSNAARHGIVGRMKKLLEMVKLQLGNPSDLRKLKTSGLAASISSSGSIASRKQMSLNEAEELVRQWQAIKAEALGPSHQVDSLSEVLDESMLAQWQGLADAAKAKSCYWKFVLLHLSVLQADILSDGFGFELAEIQALLEEAAELVDESQEKNPTYYSTYKIHYILKRQEDGSWRFCQNDVQTVL